MSVPYLSGPPDVGLRLIPPQATEQATRVDALYIGLLAVSGLLTLILIVLIVCFGLRYRAGSRASRAGGPSQAARQRIEVGWALILLSLFLSLFAWGGGLYLDMYHGRETAMTIEVIGKQWMWKVQHPDGAREINSVHVPVDEPIRLRLTSQDVIHSFFVPAFRLKRDVLPERYVDIWFKATRPGAYHLFCAEYCGLDHSRMRGKVVVLSRTDYQDWLTRNGNGPTPETAGKALFQSHGCSGCHLGRSTVRAPSLAGIYGRSVPLAGGGTVMADEAYLRDAIVLPQKHIVAGYEPIMPSFRGQIAEDEILQIIAYIKSLQPGDWDRPAGGAP